MKANLLKTFIKMSKYAVFCIILQSCLYSFAIAHSSKGQVKMLSEIELRITFNESTLEEVFREIEKNTDFTFAYLANDLPKEKITLSNQSRSLKEILLSIAEQAGVSFLRVNETIHVKPFSDRRGIVEEVFEEALQITGTVTSAEGEPLPGVNIRVKDTNIGTVTDVDGSYSIQVPDENAVLEFSFIGYTKQEVVVKGKTAIDVTLAEDAQKLDEVVVVGYGKQKKVNLTGSVSMIDFEDEAMESRPLQNMSTALSGMVAGLSVNQANGRPGSGASVKLRGIGSLNAGQNPLIIVDGQVGNLNAINPNDVASVSVLKDAASAAIYGSRASNGVILITTKSGQDTEGKVTFGYTGNIGVSEATNTIDVISNTGDHLELINQVQRNSGMNPSYSQEFIEEWRENSKTDPILYPNTDWWDVLLHPGIVQDHNFSARGGSEKISFYSSLGFQENTGIIDNTSYEKFNFRNNMSYKVNDWLEIGNIVTALFAKDDPGTNNAIFRWMQATTPGTLPQHPDGRYGTSMTGGVEQSLNNPLRNVRTQLGENSMQRYTGKLFGNLTPVKGLTITGSYFIDMNHRLQWNTNRPTNSWNFQTNSITLERIGAPISLRNHTVKQQRQVVDVYANYKRSIYKHNLSVLAGYNQEYVRRDAFNAVKSDLFSIEVPVLNAAASVRAANGNTSDFALQSYFGRLSYNYDEKYLFEINMRADGSSRFSPENRWGVFPSASAGWVISEEQFWNSIENTVNFFKIRSSYGRLGNNSIGNYDWQSVYNSNNYSFGGEVVRGLAPNSFANRNITWETTDILNLGADIRFFESLDLSVDYYDKFTHGILARTPIPLVNGGLAAPLTNSAAVRNRGLEAEINYRRTIGEFSFSIGANGSYNKNKIESYKGDFLEPHGVGVWTEGQPIGKYWLREVDHIVQKQEEIDNLVAQGWTFDTSTPGPGDILYRDNNGDQRIDEKDRVLMGNPIPLFNYGANLSLSYKGFDFYTQLSGVAGRDRYLSGALYSLQRHLLGYLFLQEFQNSWTEENTNTSIPKLYATDQKNDQRSDYFLRSADYLKIRSVQVGYTLPSGLTEKLEINNLRVYVNLENYFTFTSWPGLDPETGLLTYPIIKTASVGVNLSF